MSRDSTTIGPLVWLLLLALLSVGMLAFVGDQNNCFANEGALGATRTPWSKSTLLGSPDPPLPLVVERVMPKLELNDPVTMRELPGRLIEGRASRLIVLQRNGQVVTFENRNDASEAELALDIQLLAKETANEKLAAARDMALDPDFEANGFLYVMWSAGEHLTPGGSRISRFKLAEDSPPKFDPASRLDLVTYPAGDHVGASLRFGPDGMFYITTGDGWLPFPPDKLKTAQNLAELRGKVLRIDVRQSSQASPYTIPIDNPFVNTAGARGEVFAFGFRNGFRSAFNPVTGSMWLADVGWERSELVHRVTKGGNHGWSLYEGPFPVDAEQVSGPGERIMPAIVMPRNEAQSITGGVFVPGNAVPTRAFPLEGHYIFGCYMNGNVWAADVTEEAKPLVKLIAETGLRIIDFAVARFEDTPAGQSDLVVLDMGGGGLYRLRANTAQSSETFPRTLSQTGLFSDTPNLMPAPGVIAYEPVVTMYRGGATTSRVIGIPTDGSIQGGKNTKAPAGTVLANTLFREVIGSDGVPQQLKIETQVLVYDGLNWDPYTYRWNEQQTDADLVAASGDQVKLTVADIRLGQREMTHMFASRAQCTTCHHVFNQGAITFIPEQLWQPASERDTLASYKVFQRGGHMVGYKGDQGDQKEAKQDLGSFAQAIFADVKHPMVRFDDERFDLDTRARSYLAANCSHCHMPAGGAMSALNLMRHVPTENMAIIDAKPAQGDFGIEGARLVVPGHPDRSVLLYRLATAGPGTMPKLGSHDPDLAGAKLLWDWIAAMPPVADAPSQSLVESPDLSRVVADVPNTEMVQQTAESPSSFSSISTVQAMGLWRELADAEPAESQARAKAIVAATADPVVAGLFEPWLDDSQRSSRVGDNPDVQDLLSRRGDAEAGARWFAEASAAQCRICHRIIGAESLVGPSLDGIGRKRNRAELLDQLLNPSAIIEPQWQTYTVLTNGGEIISGLRVSQNEEAWVLRSAEGRDTLVPVEEIESSKTREQSMMPAGLLASMSPEEVANLLEYLQSLR